MKTAFKTQVKQKIQSDKCYITYLVTTKSKSDRININLKLQNIFPVLQRLKAHFWSYNISNCKCHLLAMPIYEDQSQTQWSDDIEVNID